MVSELSVDCILVKGMRAEPGKGRNMIDERPRLAGQENRI